MIPHAKRVTPVVVVGLIFAARAALGIELEVTIDAGKHDRSDEIVSVPIEVPESVANVSDAWVLEPTGKIWTAQLTEPPLTSVERASREGRKPRMLYVRVSKLDAGETTTARLLVDQDDNVPKGIKGKPMPRFGPWVVVTPKKEAELRLGTQPVLRYMYEPIDNSSKARRDETYKPYHHLFDPRGERLVTKGPGGLFPHHRGLFFGFNKITYGDNQQADTWHCNRGEWQAHTEYLGQEAGPLLGRHRVAIDWHGRDGKVFVKEQRELTAYNLLGGTLVEFASKLTSTGGKVHLDGDPQHAGFQFRASQEVPDKTAKQTYYLRPDGKDKPGSFRNWPQSKQHENLPWNALSFVLGERRYTAVYLDHPKNPKPARYSERDYGRFGSYFAADVEPDKPLTVNYRLWLQEGEMTVEQAKALSRQFVEPATATVAVTSNP